MAALGLEFAASVLGGLVLGYYLDSWTGASPWFVLAGTLGGLATAVWRILLLTRRFQRVADKGRDG